jgi:hypothetical protein
MEQIAYNEVRRAAIIEERQAPESVTGLANIVLDGLSDRGPTWQLRRRYASGRASIGPRSNTGEAIDLGHWIRWATLGCCMRPPG